MKPSRVLLAVCLLALAGGNLSAQDDPPRVAVIPFNFISVSKADAEVITGLFETALVKTAVYNVIEQNQIRDILSAQEQSLNECTDEQCAVEFGKLLAAEQIVLGTLSSLGGKYILNAKIIDVTTGKNVKADRESTDDLASMADGCELLAYKLAGLTYRTGGEELIARELGELFVETVPPRADIYVNGVKKGVSPNLISKVPLGTVVIECRKENLFGRSEVEVTATTRRITIELSLAYGNLFIQSDLTELDVYLDGEKLGAFGSGFFEKVPVGERIVTLKGDGLSWEGEVEVSTGESARIDAAPREYGSIAFRLPDGASGEIEGRLYRETIRAEGVLEPVWVGEYTVRVTGERYEPYDDEVEVKRGMTVRLEPELSYTSAYREELARSEQGLLQAELEGRVVQLERLFAGEHRVVEGDLQKVRDLAAEIEGARYRFEHLAERAALLAEKGPERMEAQGRLEELQAKRAAAAARLARGERAGAGVPVLSWVSSGIGAASLGTSVACFLLGNSAYDRYTNATTLADVLQEKRRFQAFDTACYASLGSAAVGAATFAILRLVAPGPARVARLRSAVEELDVAIGQARRDLEVKP